MGRLHGRSVIFFCREKKIHTGGYCYIKRPRQTSTTVYYLVDATEIFFYVWLLLFYLTDALRPDSTTRRNNSRYTLDHFASLIQPLSLPGYSQISILFRIQFESQLSRKDDYRWNFMPLTIVEKFKRFIEPTPAQFLKCVSSKNIHWAFEAIKLN